MEKEFKNEKALHTAIAEFISKQYPRVIFSCDPAGMRVTMGTRMEIKRKTPANWKNLDIPIFKANKTHHGLFLEVKEESPYKQNGELKSDPRLKEQNETIFEHINNGYFACFVWSLEMAKEIINQYMNDDL